MLAFIGMRPGMTALDLSAGGGYTTELLARAVGPTGTVYGQSQPRDPNRAPPAAPKDSTASAALAAAAQRRDCTTRASGARRAREEPAPTRQHRRCRRARSKIRFRRSLPTARSISSH